MEFSRNAHPNFDTEIYRRLSSFLRAANRLGWDVERLASWFVPDELREVVDPVLYLEGLFGPTLVEKFRLRLLEPPEDWLPRLPVEYRKR